MPIRINKSLSRFYTSSLTVLDSTIRLFSRTKRGRLTSHLERELESIESPYQTNPNSIITDIPFNHAAIRLLVIATHAPTLNHAGGLRILDILTEIKRHSPFSYIEVFTSANSELYGSLSHLTQVVDQIVIADNYDFSIEQYRRKAPKQLLFDIVDFQFPQSVETVSSYRTIGKKIIFTPMESYIRNECIESGIERISGERLKSSLAIEEAHLCNVVDEVVCVSSEDALAVSYAVPNAKINVIETGISDYEFGNALSSSQPDDLSVCYVAYFGSDTNREALRWYLNEVHPLISNSLPSYEFRIVGRGDVTSVMRSPPPGVRYIGEVDLVAPHISAAAVGIAPAFRGSGFRGKINQYAALERPCVATPLAARGLAYTPGISIFVEDDPERFAAAVIKMLTNKDLYRQVSINAKEVCQANYGWQKKWPALASTYNLPHSIGVARPSIHAIIPSYQHAPHLEERIKSVFEQVYDNMRVTIIDDHSDDDSDKIIRALQTKYNFHYIRNERNSGSPFSAWEYAVENTSEDLIWICESDDVSDPFLTAKLVKVLTYRANTAFAYCASHIIDKDGKITGSTEGYFSEYFHRSRWEAEFISTGKVELFNYQRFGMTVPNMSSCLIRADYFKKAYNSDVKSLRLAGDWLMIGRILSEGDVAYTPERLNRFRRHDNTSRMRTDPARVSAEHVFVRLSLCETLSTNELQTLDTIKHDLRLMLIEPDMKQPILDELKNISEKQYKKLLGFIDAHLADNQASPELNMLLQSSSPRLPCSAYEQLSN